MADLVARLGAATIPDLAAESAGQFPDRVAVSVDGVPVTHAGLDAAAGRVAGWLAARIYPGDRVLLAAGPGPASCAATWAPCGPGRWWCWPTRGTPQPNSPTWSPTPAPGSRSPIPGRPERLATLARPPETVLVTDPDCAGRALAWCPGRGTRAARLHVRHHRPAEGVPLTHRQLATSIRAAMAAWRWTADDVLVHALPLFHQHGLGGVHATLMAGSTAHLRSRFDPAGLIAAVRRAAATVLFGVPASYQALLDAARERGRWLSGPGRGGGGQRAAGGRPRWAACGWRCAGRRRSARAWPRRAARPARPAAAGAVRHHRVRLDVSNPLGAARADTVGLPLPGVECRGAADPAAACARRSRG